jgi:CRP/FNR family transcriptional regulator
MSNSTRNILKNYEIFQSLSPSDTTSLERVAILKDINKGEYVVHEAEKASHFHLVNKGKLKIVKHTTFGKDVIIDIAAAGEIFLIEPIFDDEFYPASAVAVEDSTILMIEKRTFIRMMNQNPKMMRLALKEMAGRLRSLNAQIKELSVGKVDHRIAKVMLKLAEKIGEEQADGRLFMDIALSRQDIADLTGTTIETAIRTMSRFAKQNLLETTKTSILIKDPTALNDIAEGL